RAVTAGGGGVGRGRQRNRRDGRRGTDNRRGGAGRGSRFGAASRCETRRQEIGKEGRQEGEAQGEEGCQEESGPEEESRQEKSHEEEAAALAFFRTSLSPSETTGKREGAAFGNEPFHSGMGGSRSSCRLAREVK